MTHPYKICSRCIMDTSDPDITFDAQGVCNHCTDFFKMKERAPYCLPPEEKTRIMDQVIAKIKTEGKSGKYDCVIGVSGGVDSTYIAYLMKKSGLRPLAVHFDNCWNSELAVHNIEKTLRNLDIDLFTYVINWEEFRDLQLAFLEASTPDSEIPTDHAIHAVLYQTAAKFNIKYVIIGFNLNSEFILPRAWSHGHWDWKYIKNVHKTFGHRPLKEFPRMSYWNMCFYKIIKKIKYFNILDYIEYDKAQAVDLLSNQLGWQYYGGKHHESIYTKFFQSYILPQKFGYDKRRAHLSTLVCSGQMTREEALNEMTKELYPPDQLKNDIAFVIKKFNITEAEFNRIMSLPKKSFRDYPSYEKSWYYKIVIKIYRLLQPLLGYQNFF